MNKKQIFLAITIILLLVLGIFLLSVVIGVSIKNLNIQSQNSTIQQDTLKCHITTYNATIDQCDQFPNITASMDKIIEKHIMMNKWVAVSQDLIYKYLNFGDTIEVIDCSYSGKYVVKDVMNYRFNNTIDILLPKGQQGISEQCRVIIKK